MPRLRVTDKQVESASLKFGIDAADAGRPWFGLNPGAEYGPAKRWAAERFVETALQLQSETRCRWLIFGAAADVELAAFIAAGLNRRAIPLSTLNLAAKTTLSELAALLHFCKLVLTNDTGPMHLAAAVGAPLVAIFGSTSPELTGPVFSDRATILRLPPPCSPCFRRDCPIDLRCLTAITASHALEAARQTLRFPPIK